MKVGVAGVGRMGAPMAKNLAAAGFDVAVWNRSAERADSVAAEIGAVACATPRELAERTKVVITMLADDAASTAVHDGDNGLLGAAGGATHLVLMGTHSPSHVTALARRAAPCIVVDAPVSGSIDAARDARLLIMPGADEETVAPVRDVLAAIGGPIICLGSVGAGATMKLAVNLLIHGLNQTLAEALVLAGAAGIDPATAYEVIEQSAAAAPMLAYRKPQYLHEAQSPVSFALSLAGKDVALAVDLAGELGVPLPQALVNLQQLRAAEEVGFGARDMGSIISYLRGET